MAYISKKIRQQVYDKFGGRCAYTGHILPPDWQVDHIWPIRLNYFGTNSEINNINNLVPCIAIVNHYKRGKDLEMFRRYMLTFHIRLSKLTKRTSLPATERRIKYMNTIADLFGITPDKPFSGKFYFETL